jgi:spectinomycin phosphotransferase
MLDKPDIPDEAIISCLRAEYGLHVVQVRFLPLGFGLSTAIYRAFAADDTEYFCKLQRGAFDATSVELPKFLSEQGIEHIIPPLTARDGRLCAALGEFNLVAYPFIVGSDGFHVEMTERQVSDFGVALKRIHTTALSPHLIAKLQREDYTPERRDRCKHFLVRLEDESFDDPVAAGLATLLQAKRDVALALIAGAERLAPLMVRRDLDYVLCHSDIHPGNIYIDVHGPLFIVDWDWATISPKERDLMHIGGGHVFMGHSTPEVEELFYRGYGQAPVDPIALAYYRYERNILAVELACEQILSSTQDSQTRAQCLEYLHYYFLPDGPIETALKSDTTGLR